MAGGFLRVGEREGGARFFSGGFFAWGKGGRAEEECSFEEEGCACPSTFSRQRFSLPGRRKKGGVNGLANARKGPPVQTFCRGKEGTGGDESVLSGAEGGYPTVFSRPCVLLYGKGKRGRGVHLFAPGGRPIHRCFFRAMAFWWAEGGRWPAGCFLLVGGKRRERSPLSCPACSFGSHSARDPKGELVGRDSFE